MDGKRRKRRPKRRQMDSVHVDLREKGLSGRRRNIRLCGGNLSETSTPLQIETVKQKNRYI